MVDRSGGGKLTGIKQIAGLKGMLQKWQTVTFGSHKSRQGNKVETDQIICYDSDEEGRYSPAPAPDIPKGYLAVNVGPRELRRFIIPTSHLSHPVFKILLEKAGEEYGYHHSGALTIPCEIEAFKRLLNCIEKKKKKAKGYNVGGSPVSEHALVCF